MLPGGFCPTVFAKKKQGKFDYLGGFEGVFYFMKIKIFKFKLKNHKYIHLK